MRWYAHGDPLKARHRILNPSKVCVVNQCGTPVYAREMCSMHYSRWNRNGDPAKRTARTTSLEVFRELVLLETDDHVLWPLGVDVGGYGRVHLANDMSRKAHQMALERREERPTGRIACHVAGLGCPKSCINYRHLYWGTHAQNMADKVIDGTNQPTRGRLDPEAIRVIRNLAGTVPQQELADRFGVKRQSISLVLNGRTWTNVA